jgi:hypothetical protein
MNKKMKNYVIKLPNYIDKLKGIREETHCSLPAAIEILYSREKYKNNVDFETAFVFLLKGYEIKSIATEKVYKNKMMIDYITIDEVRSRWVVMLCNKEIELPDVF